jgi:large subunit ribosomal protein L30
MAGRLRITLKRSTIGQKPKIRASVETLGLRKLHHSVEHDDTPSVRGLVRSATHLLDVEEI